MHDICCKNCRYFQPIADEYGRCHNLNLRYRYPGEKLKGDNKLYYWDESYSASLVVGKHFGCVWFMY